MKEGVEGGEEGGRRRKKKGKRKQGRVVLFEVISYILTDLFFE